MGQLRARAHRRAREHADEVAGEAERAETLAEAEEAVLAHAGDVVVGEVEVAEVLQLVEGAGHVVEAVPLQVEQLQRGLQPGEGVGVDVADPVHAQVDSPRRDGLEGILLEALDIVVVEVEIIDGEGVVEHVLGHGGDEVLAQVELVQPLLVAEENIF